MIILKIIGMVAIVIAVLFILSLFIYFFNLDMKFASKLIKPLTAYYNWSKNRRELSPLVPTLPIYIPGLFLTASRPSRIDILFASYFAAIIFYTPVLL